MEGSQDIKESEQKQLSVNEQADDASRTCSTTSLHATTVGTAQAESADRKEQITANQRGDKLEESVPAVTEEKAGSFSAAEQTELLFMSEEERQIIVNSASLILLPDESAKMHANIVAHRKVIKEWRKQHDTADNKAQNKRDASVPFLCESISDSLIPRACRIIDALIKTMEPLGCSLTDDLGFNVNGEIVRLSITESQDKVTHALTKEENMLLLKHKEERRRYLYASKPQIRKYDYIFNGKLTVTVNGRRSFRDRKLYVVENSIRDIMIEIYEAAEVLRLARVAREEAERQRQAEELRKEELQKRYNAEVDRTNALINQVKDYDTACRIRQYIASVEASESATPETLAWIEWAKEKADWFDPTIAKEDGILGQRKHSLPEDLKKLEHVGYHRHWF